MVREIAPKTQLGVIKSNVNQGGETIAPDIVYPESDGKPMADNTEQFKWIVKILEGYGDRVQYSIFSLLVNDAIAGKTKMGIGKNTNG